MPNVPGDPTVVRFGAGVSKEDRSKLSNVATDAFCGVPKSSKSSQCVEGAAKEDEAAAFVDDIVVEGIDANSTEGEDVGRSKSSKSPKLDIEL